MHPGQVLFSEDDILYAIEVLTNYIKHHEEKTRQAASRGFPAPPPLKIPTIDLGKVARTGTVQVGPFPEHRSFAQVHHLLAEVTATLAPGVSAVDLLRATFPGGSITGCPKLRCLEILESLEVTRRGVYTGAVGWFGPGDRMHLNIAIRTLVHRQGLVRGNAGGGVTALSDPHQEWRESLAKMAGLERALQCRVAVPEGAGS